MVPVLLAAVAVELYRETLPVRVLSERDEAGCAASTPTSPRDDNSDFCACSGTSLCIESLRLTLYFVLL